MSTLTLMTTTTTTSRDVKMTASFSMRRHKDAWCQFVDVVVDMTQLGVTKTSRQLQDVGLDVIVDDVTRSQDFVNLESGRRSLKKWRLPKTMAEALCSGRFGGVVRATSAASSRLGLEDPERSAGPPELFGELFRGWKRPTGPEPAVQKVVILSFTSIPIRLQNLRRHLKQCPLIAEEEDNLKILRCRQNHITEIEYLSLLTNLCVLDMCDNELRTTSGLQGLRSLRVLLLSGNRIEELSGLETLTSLEILSASNNLIKSARGLEGLKELCILNLSSNQVSCLGSELNQLTQLTELYVEKNKVTSIDCLQELPNLKKLFLSNNFIKSLDDAANLMSCPSLLQLSLKGCPVTRLQGYRQALLTGLPQLKYLDYSFITEEERRRARLSWQRETRRRRRLTQLRRHGALLDAAITSSRLLWECPDPQASLSTLKEKTFIMLHASQYGSSEDESSSASLSTFGALDDAYCQAAELKDVTVEIYGPGAIAKLLCQSLSQRSVASITVLKLHYVCFQDVFSDLIKLRKKFPRINCLYLRCCRVDKLCHLKMLSRLRGLKSITVEDAGNRVTLLSVWKPYFIFCLGEDVETLNSSPCGSAAPMLDKFKGQQYALAVKFELSCPAGNF
ncbi:hypothetical protein HPB47_011864, partial [Ixodes persulcatus]